MGAHLWGALLRFEVDVVDAEAVGVAVGPLVVVHQAPAEVAANGNAFGDAAMKLGEVVAEIHDAVGVVDVAIGSEDVGGGGSVLGDVDLFDVPELGGELWATSRGPRDRRGARGSSCAGRRLGRMDDGEAGGGVVGADVGGGVDVEADEVDGAADGFHVGGGELRRVRAVVCEIGVGVSAFHDDGEIAGVGLAHGLGGGGDVLGSFDDGDAGAGVFCEADFGAGFGVGADGLHSEAVGEHGMMTNLIDAGRGKLEAGSMTSVAVADVDEGTHLVEGHEVLDAVGEMFGDVAGVVGEGLGGVARLPAALVFEGLGEIPVKEGAVGLDVGGEQLVDEAVVEVEALGVGCAGALGKTRGHATEKR